MIAKFMVVKISDINVYLPILVDGGYTDWSDYGTCSKTCGEGIQIRERTCSNPTPRHGGEDCSSLGNATETRPCDDGPCPGEHFN